MAECLVAETVRVRDGAAAGVPGAKVFHAQHPTQARPHARDHPVPQAPPPPKSFAILDADGFGGHPEDMLPHSCVCD